MFIFTSAKNNLLAKFKARFSPDSKGNDYLFYPKEYDQGYTCSETEYMKFVSDFQKFLKVMTRTMWIWFLLGMPLIIGLAVWQNYDFGTLEKVLIILFPLPFLTLRGWRIYNAPLVLVEGKRPVSKQRSQKQIFESRIKGMSWMMFAAMIAFPMVGTYIFLTDDSLKDWQVALGLCCFLVVLIFGIYLILRKREILTKERDQR